MTEKKVYTLLSLYVGKSVSEIAEDRGVTTQNISQDLRVLIDEGFIVKRHGKRGTEVDFTDLGEDVVQLMTKHSEGAILALRDEVCNFAEKGGDNN